MSPALGDANGDPDGAATRESARMARPGGGSAGPARRGKLYHNARLKLPLCSSWVSWRSTGWAPLGSLPMSEGCVSIGFMSHLPVSGDTAGRAAAGARACSDPCRGGAA